MIVVKMAKFDREYVIPLGAVLKAPRIDRAVRAVGLVREFVLRHAKADEVNVGNSLNEFIWKTGIARPPKRIRVHILKDDKTNIAYAELPGVPIRIPSEEELVEKEKAKEEKRKEKEKAKEKEKEEKKSEKKPKEEDLKAAAPDAGSAEKPKEEPKAES